MNSKLEAYKAEARERWGNTPAYKEYDEKTKSYGEDKWSGLAADMDGIFSRFALCMKKGVVALEGKCRKFCYDPCKRLPLKAKAPDFEKYDQDDISL